MDPTINREAERYIPIAKPCLGQREAEAVAKAVGDNWISTGPRVEEFESEIAVAHGKKFGVACNSGTTALHLAMVGMGIGEESSVCMPTMTMVACANAAVYCGAVPEFIESETVTGNIDIEMVRHRSADLILVPHLYGMPARGTKLLDSADVIEDCAESHYATFPDGSPVGSHGRFAVFSFYANKIVACGEGGMVITDDESAAIELRSLRSHAFTPGEHFNHQRLAFGYRMTDLQAAVGLIQHSRRLEFLAKRRELYHRYCANLAGVPWISWARRPSGSVDWMFPAIIEPGAWEGEGLPTERFEGMPIEVDSVRDYLRWKLADVGVETRTWFKPMHRQGHLKAGIHRSFPIADSFYANGICLPIYFEMELSDVDYICERLIAAARPAAAASV